MASTENHTVELNMGLLPLEWLLGTWESDEPGEGCFPSIKPFRYMETLSFSHVGQPVINFMFNAFHAETKKPMHRECGFIRMQPGTNRVAFIIAQNSGLVEIEEGELTAQRLELQSQAVARTSFAKEPHVQQVASSSHPDFIPVVATLHPRPRGHSCPFRFAEFSSCGQMASSSRQFLWQRTTSHRRSTCTSSTVGHFDPNPCSNWNYI
uniref:THAP domain containing 4 n=1 Tax=Takifugu rubripes TaxID=31033 RepID=A0A3B5K5P1_TAKRU